MLRELALLVSEEPELAAGCTAAMFGSEPDVRQLRLYIGKQIHDRIESAASRGSPQGRLLELAFFGAMVERPASATRRTSTWPTDSPRPPS